MQCGVRSLFRLTLFLVVSTAAAVFAQSPGEATASFTRPAKATQAKADIGAVDNVDSEIKLLKSQLTSTPADAFVLNELATRYAATGDLDTAVEYMELSIRYRDDHPRTLLNLASIYDRLGRMAEARDTVRRSVELDPAYGPAFRYLCELQLHMREHAEAFACFKKYVTKFDEDAATTANFGIALARAGLEDEAVEYLEERAAAMPRSAEIKNALGMAYVREKRYKDAIRVLKDAVEASPHVVQIRFNLAIAYLGQKNRPGALSQYRFIKRKDPTMAAQLYSHIYSGMVVDARTAKAKN